MKVNRKEIKNGLINTGKTVASGIKTGGQKAADMAVVTKDGAVALKEDFDRARIKPVTLNEINEPAFRIPRMIYIVGDDKYSDHYVMKDAIGHIESEKGMEYLVLYSKYAESIGCDFYPMVNEFYIYYVDPCYPRKYICLNDYFEFIEKAKFNEMEIVAQKIGAKHLDVELTEEHRLFFSKKAKIKGKSKLGDVEMEGQYAKEETETIKSVGHADFNGQKPERPELVYLKNEEEIKQLIELRLNENNQIKSKEFQFKYNRTTGISTMNAAKIDAVLKKIGIKTKNSISNKAEEEDRRYFKYKVEF